MNGKQLFCLSLILLSVAMGVHWFKNKPKAKPRPPSQTRVALNLDDLQIQDDPQNTGGEQQPAGDPDAPEDEVLSDPTETPPPDGDNPADTDPASSTESVTENTASGSTELVDADPIIAALKGISRNPFERSPYAKLVEEIRAKEGLPEDTGEKKTVTVLTADFSATIGTKKELIAVIDSRLYRKGELFQEKKIIDIKNELVSLESQNEIFLIPKVGVNITVAEDGSYSVEDNFHKN
jgi:hypothetical protein